jgi:hypothetical protein
MDLGGLLFVAIGLFALSGAGFNWDWFMNHRKARLFSSIFGRSGARFFYGLLGVGLIVLGILMMAGIVKNSR